MISEEESYGLHSRNNLSVLAEDEINGTMKSNSRRTKRTESFV